MGRKIAGFALGSLAFAVAEYLWLRPVLGAGLRSVTIYAFLLSANLFYLYNLIFHIALKRRWVVAGYVAWYLVLFLFFVAVSPGPAAEHWRFGGQHGLHRQLLFGLFLMGTSAFFHLPSAFGFLVAVLVAYFVFPFFAEATLALLIVFYLIVIVELRDARRARRYVVLWGFVLGFALLVAVLFPIVHLATQRSPQDLDTLLRGTPRAGPAKVGGEDHVDLAARDTRQAIWTSLQTATISTLVVLALGVPLAYFLVRSDFPGRSVLDTLVDLPIVLPPPVAGLALVFLLGPDPGIGTLLRERLGLDFVSDWKGIVLAQVFVSSPFLVRSAQAAFRAIDPKLENVSRTLGATPLRTLWRVTLPLSARGIFMGCILTWGRAIGEFGSVSVIAEHPETMPVRIYKEFATSGAKGPSLSLAILMVFLCVAVFAGLHLLASRTVWRNVRTIWSRLGDSSH